MAAVSLAALRKRDPDRPRSYRLPYAGVLCPIAFICANFIVYWSGWNTVFWLYVLIALGFVLFGVYQAMIPAERRAILNWRSGSWILPWLVGLAIISWQGQYSSASPVLGITLNDTNNIPFWWDLVVVAVFSLVIYYFAVSLALTTEEVATAVKTVEEEARAEQSALAIG
ncbi:MAG TPA: hypothetical protein VNG13_14195 [Mycobacteriales bacterium]|nr:hypothetical protein [Mycobacteriales bacterium]